MVAAGLQLGFFIETSSAILRCPGEEMVSPLVLTARGEAVFQGGHVVSVFLCPVGVLLLPQGISLKIWGSNGDVKPCISPTAEVWGDYTWTPCEGRSQGS